jgi:hypothetical protein
MMTEICLSCGGAAADAHLAVMTSTSRQVILCRCIMQVISGMRVCNYSRIFCIENQLL